MPILMRRNWENTKGKSIAKSIAKCRNKEDPGSIPRAPEEKGTGREKEPRSVGENGEAAAWSPGHFPYWIWGMKLV